MNLLSGPSAIGFIILAAAMWDDFKTRKFHNWLFVTSCLLAGAFIVFTSGWTGLSASMIAFTFAILLSLPLVLAKILGAGDMKLMAALSMTLTWMGVIEVGLLALFWGAAFGLLQVLLSGKIKIMARNLLALTSGEKVEATALHQIPFTVAIFLGWLSYLVHGGIL